MRTQALPNTVWCSDCKAYVDINNFAPKQLQQIGNHRCKICMRKFYARHTVKDLKKVYFQKVTRSEIKRNLCNWNETAIYC